MVKLNHLKGIFVVVFVFLSLFTIALYFLLQSQWGLERIRRYGEMRLESAFSEEGEVEIQGIKGNPFGHLILSGVEIRTPDVLVRIEQCYLRYNPLKLFIYKELHFHFENGEVENLDYILADLHLGGKLNSRNRRIRLNLKEGSGNLKKKGVENGEVRFEGVEGEVVFFPEGGEGVFKMIEGGKVTLSTTQSHFTGRVFNSRLMIQNSSLSLEEVSRLFFPSLPMSGSVELEGEFWLEGNEPRLNGDLEFEEGNIMGFAIGEVKARVFLEGGILTLNTEDLQGGTIGILVNTKETPPYIHFDGELDRMNLSRFFPFYETRLDGNVRGIGRGLGDWTVTFSLGESELHHLTISELEGTLEMKNERLFIPTLMVRKGGSRIQLTGDQSEDELLYNLESKDVELSEVLPFFYDAYPVLEGMAISGKFSCDLVSRRFPENPSLFGSFWIRDPQFQNQKAGLLSADLQFSSLGRNLTGEGKLAINHWKMLNRTIESLDFHFGSRNGDVQYTLQSVTPEETLRISGKGNRIKKTTFIHWDKLNFRGKEFEISNEEPIHITLQEDGFALSTGPINFMDGTLNLWTSIEGKGRRGESFLVIEGDGVQLDRVSKLLNLPWDFAGLGKFNFTARGNLEAPRFQFAFEGRDFRMDEASDPHTNSHIALRNVNFDSISLAFSHENGKITVEKGELYRKGEMSTISGYLPFDWVSELGNGQFVKPSTHAEEISIHLDLKNIGVWIFSPFRDLFDVSKGEIYGEIDLHGTLSKPELDGMLKLSSGEMFIPSSSTQITKVEGVIRLEEDRVYLERFHGSSGEGWIEAEGSVAIDLNRLQADSFEMYIHAKRSTFDGFSDVHVLVDAELRILGTPDFPAIEGSLSIIEGGIFREFRSTEEVPLNNSNLTYEFNIQAERNIWLKNSNADIEFKGEISVRGEAGRRVISGILEAVQGEFFYMDHSFEVSQGLLTFTNSPELNPSMDILAETKIRYKPNGSDQVKSGTIQLHATGTLREPHFDLIPPIEDDLSREEMIAYLTLNMSLEEFTESGMTGIMSGAGERGMAYLERRLSRELERSTGLDALIMETQLFSEEKRARFTFGKYLRRDLFVSYSADLLAMESNRFKVEYYLGKKVSLYGQRSGSDIEKEYDAGLEYKHRY